LALELLARRQGAPHGQLRATFLDVGQGDSAIVDLPNGDAVVIDGGGLVGSPVDPGARVLEPALRQRRRDAVRLVILSHPHPDHFLGLRAGLSDARVGEAWDTGQGEREGAGGAYAEWLQGLRARGVPVRRPDEICGAHEIGGARVEVLAPCPGPSPDWGPNDNSFVVRFVFGSRAFLFVGDAEREEEAAVLEAAGSRGDVLRADVLKVGHHGSRTSSTPAFLAAVAPAEAVISVGSRNRFGHPSAVTLSALQKAGAAILRTDVDGEVTASTDGTSLVVQAVAR
jgi:competence protein ComEC